MRVIPPLTQDGWAITPEMLIASPIAEPDPTTGEVAYVATDNYAAGDRVVDVTSHRMFESLVGQRKVVTISQATPGVVSWVSHGLILNTPIVFSTTGALPTGLTAGTVYYVKDPQADSFTLATSPGGAAIATSGAQNGVHTAIADPNKGHDPTTDGGAWWKDVGPTNRWRLFDLLRNTKTVAPSPFSVTFAPGERIDAIGIVGMVADDVRIEVTVAGVQKYARTINLVRRTTTGWRSYFFGKFRRKGDVCALDLPPQSSSQVKLTWTRSDGDVEVGSIVAGQQIYIGEINYGAVSGQLNFSSFNRDEGGEAEFVKKRSVPKTDQVVKSKYDLVPTILDARDQLNAIVAFWTAVDDPAHPYFEPLQMLGVARRWDLNIELPQHVRQDITLEGP